MVRQSWRHFRALNRVHYINWVRTPFCSCLIIILPALLMTGLMTIRYYIPAGAKIDFQGILDYKMNVMPGLMWKNGKWNKNTKDNIEHSKRVRDMAIYANYTDGTHDNPADYDIGKDWFGTQYFMPFQCIKQTSVTIPKRTSPGIAITRVL